MLPLIYEQAQSRLQKANGDDSNHTGLRPSDYVTPSSKFQIIPNKSIVDFFLLFDERKWLFPWMKPTYPVIGLGNKSNMFLPLVAMVCATLRISVSSSNKFFTSTCLLF
jgi:hypothetical protein